MTHPPSLPDDVIARAFRAENGELGVLPSDARAFLDACRADGVTVYGWELWVVDEEARTIMPVHPGGPGDADETERQLAACDIAAHVEPGLLPHVRVNVTL